MKFKIVKMFDAFEIKEATRVNVVAYVEGNNDSAVPWWVESPSSYEDENGDYQKINDYLLNNGAEIDEEVWIEISW